MTARGLGELTENMSSVNCTPRPEVLEGAAKVEFCMAAQAEVPLP